MGFRISDGFFLNGFCKSTDKHGKHLEIKYAYIHYTYMHAYINTYIHTYMHRPYIHTCVHADRPAHINTCIQIPTLITYLYTHTYTNT